MSARSSLGARSEGPAAPAASPTRIGRFSGEVSTEHATPGLRAWLAELPQHLAAASAHVVASGRNRHVRIAAPLAGGTRNVLVKVFGRNSMLRDLRERSHGTKACRSWLAAYHLERHGVGTPSPVSYLERWDGSHLAESYFVAVHEEGAQTLREALIELFNDHPQAPEFMALLALVADGIKRMHDAGFLHNDLGNPNILLHPLGSGRWSRFQVIDLNRGRIRETLSLRERARDVSRLDLPSHLRHVFLKMYWNTANPSQEWVSWTRTYYRLHRVRVRSRRWRHPIREARLDREAQAKPSRGMPAPRDLWIWDERCGQPLTPMLGAQRRQHLPATRNLHQLADTLSAAPRLWREYRTLRAEAFAKPVSFAGRVGMSLEPGRLDPGRELELLAGLGTLPTCVRLYRHDTPAQTQLRIDFIRRLHAAGHRVAVALVQDRRAVRDAALWRSFLESALDEVGGLSDYVEIGHAINRSKWGIWGLEDVAALYAPMVALRVRFPHVRFIGPAAIDFEYPFVLSALKRWPASVPLSALSHHLYVDRRGAPESTQAGFGAVEKFALARAIARVAAPVLEDRLIVSEVNWPIVGTAPFCPVSAPHVLPGQRSGSVAVSEDQCANYMLRYYLLAIGSGLVERVYWWRLSSHGFGLVDDADGRPRVRPAYRMLQHFLRLLGDATLLETRLPPGEDRKGAYRFRFVRSDGERVTVAYAHGGSVRLPEIEAGARTEDAFGEPMPESPIELGPRPVYVRGAQWLLALFAVLTLFDNGLA